MINKQQKAVLRPKEAAKYLGFSTTTLWRKEKEDPDFPKKITFFIRCCGYLRSDLDLYIQKKMGGQI